LGRDRQAHGQAVTDDTPVILPQPSAEFLAARRKRITADAELREVEAEAQSTADLFAIVQAAAGDLARFDALPCRGLVANLPNCSDAYATTCAERERPSCPRRIAAFDAEQARAALRQRMAAAGVPEDAQDAIAALFPTEATQAVDAFFADPDQRILVLSGGMGLGKSVAAANAIHRFGGGRYATAAKLCDFGDDGKAARAAAEKTRLLVIDDLGSEYSGDKGWTISIFDALLCLRHSRKLRTIITTNLGRMDFVKRYGGEVDQAGKVKSRGRIADRIVGNGRFVTLVGKSLRDRRGK